MGTIYLEIQRGNLAAREFRRVLELEPRHGDALLTLAGIHTASREYETALSYLDQALECHPDRVSVLFARAVALRGLGRDQEAEAAVQEIPSLDPTHGKGRALLHGKAGSPSNTNLHSKIHK
jgi:tetratricopeptide (TPR) repeat protein